MLFSFQWKTLQSFFAATLFLFQLTDFLPWVLRTSQIFFQQGKGRMSMTSPIRLVNAKHSSSILYLNDSVIASCNWTSNKFWTNNAGADYNWRIMNCTTHYVYITTNVDHILVVSKNPMVTIEALQKCCPLKRVGTPEYYLGGDMIPQHDSSGVTCLATQLQRGCISKTSGKRLKSYSTSHWKAWRVQWIQSIILKLTIPFCWMEAMLQSIKCWQLPSIGLSNWDAKVFITQLQPCFNTTFCLDKVIATPYYASSDISNLIASWWLFMTTLYQITSKPSQRGTPPRKRLQNFPLRWKQPPIDMKQYQRSTDLQRIWCPRFLKLCIKSELPFERPLISNFQIVKCDLFKTCRAIINMYKYDITIWIKMKAANILLWWSIQHRKQTQTELDWVLHTQ